MMTTRHRLSRWQHNCSVGFRQDLKTKRQTCVKWRAVSKAHAEWERASDSAVRSRSVPLQSQGPAAARPQGRRVRSSFGSSVGSYVLSPLLIHLHRCPSESQPWSWSPVTAVRMAVVSVLLYIRSPVFGILWTGILWPALVACDQPWGPVRT